MNAAAVAVLSEVNGILTLKEDQKWELKPQALSFLAKLEVSNLTNPFDIIDRVAPMYKHFSVPLFSALICERNLKNFQNIPLNAC